MELTVHHRSTLAALIKAFLPENESVEASDLKARIETIHSMVAATTTAEQQEFRQLLDLLQGRVVPLIWAGKAKPFTDLSREQQVRFLQQIASSRLGLMRKAFMTLKKLCLFSHYGQPTGDSMHWQAMGYPGPENLQSESTPMARITVQQAEEGETVDCDVLVIGSGAGGGIVAGMLAEAGKDVVLVEKGGYLEGHDFNNHESEMVRSTFDRAGAFTTRDGGVSIFAGSCLGGGTTINWSASFATPGYILEEWHRGHGLDFAMGSEYGKHMQEVMHSVGVKTEENPHNVQNGLLFQGSQKLGRNPEIIARNVDGCSHGDGRSCGYCSLGCRQGQKNGTMKTWIRRAVAHGARVYVNTGAQEILHGQGKVVGAKLVQNSPNQHPVHFQVRAKQVVVAAGAIHSPALLMRSGIDHPALGRHLYFHPTVAVAGFYDQPVNPWHGRIMTALDKKDLRLDGNYGYWIETPPVHAGMGAIALPWQHPRQHADDLVRLGHMATFIVLTRDLHGGRVTVDKSGETRVAYDLHPYDRKHMLRGIRSAFDLHRAAGAAEVLFPHGTYSRFKLRTSKLSSDSYLNRMHKWGWSPNRYALFTAHQMGTCGMGGDHKRHPFAPNGESKQIKGLFIADGSAMPSSAGINPMISIMSLAGWVAKGMR